MFDYTSCSKIEVLDFSRMPREDWDHLYAKSQQASPFLSYDFLRSWLKSFSIEEHALVLGAYENGALRAAAPLIFRRRVGFSDWLEFLGTGPLPGLPDGLVDRTGFLISAGFEHLTDTLINAILTNYSNTPFLLRYLPTDSLLCSTLATISRKTGRTILQRVASRSLFCCLPASQEDLWASWSKKRRKSYRQSSRKLEKHGRIVTQVHSGKDYDSRIFKHMQSVDERSWKAKCGSNHMQNDKVRHFFQYMLEKMCYREEAAVALLQVENVPIAYEVLMYGQSTMYGYIKAFDDDYSHASPGTLLSIAVMEDAIQKGLKCYDMLRGDEAYKQTLGRMQRDEADFLILPKTHSGSWLAWLLAIGIPRTRELVRDTLTITGLLEPAIRPTGPWKLVGDHP